MRKHFDLVSIEDYLGVAKVQQKTRWDRQVKPTTVFSAMVKKRCFNGQEDVVDCVPTVPQQQPNSQREKAFAFPRWPDNFPIKKKNLSKERLVGKEKLSFLTSDVMRAVYYFRTDGVDFL